LHGVEVTQCGKCGKEEIAVPRIGQLHRVLADLFVTQSRMLAPVEIRFLRKHVGLSTAVFADMMGVTRETVSRWETGATTMGATADRLLRAIVLTQEPSENYAIDDLLRSLKDTPVPHRLSAVPMCNRRDRGWTMVGHKLAMA
jgi:putative zinc finger/helix-turn-helix YgiT family protein